MKCPACGFEFHNRRSKNQQALLHKLLRAFSDASGIPFDRAKMRMKYEGGEWVDVPVSADKLRQFISHPPWAGDYLEIGTGMHDGNQVARIVYVKSEAEYTKEEETRLIEYVISRCIEADADLDFMEAM